MTDRVALGGVDVFHLMNDRAMRARGLPGNHCLFVAELAGQLDVPRLERRLATAVASVDELRFRLPRLQVPGVPPRWVVTGAAPSRLRVRGLAQRSVLEAVEGLLAERVDGDTPWALDLLRDGRRGVDTVVLRWFHPLTDGKGAERLVRWLGSGEGDAPDPLPPADERSASSERPLAALDRKARLALMQAYKAHSMALGRVPVLSLSSTLAARAATGRTRLLRIELTAAETRAFDQRVRKVARLADTSLMVIAVARLVDRAMRARGFAPPRTVVPLPVSLDPKADCRRMFGNHLTMLMVALDRDDLRDEARAVAHLAEQQRAIVREKLDLGMNAALSFARALPAPAYRFLLDRPFGGEMGSFVLSNPGAVPLTTFLGQRVTSAYPVPTVVLPPGFQVIFTRFEGRLSALVVYLDGVLAPAEAGRLAQSLPGELLGERAETVPASGAMV